MDEAGSYLGTLFLDGFVSGAPFSSLSVFLKLVAVAVLVAANAFFVASEFALVSVRRAKLERSTAGSRGARAALRLLNNPTLFISATQLGITLASLALGWIGEPT